MPAPDQHVTAIKLRAILDRIADLDEAAPAQTPAEGLKVDLVAIKQRAGFNMLTVADWQNLPAEERKAVVLDNRAIFLHREEPVPVRAALTWLKEQG